MSIPCTTCDHPLETDQERCPTCGAPASPAPDETLAVAGPQRGEADPPPWSIPIREPGTPAPDERPGGRGRVAGLALLALAAFLLTVALGSQLLGDDDGSGTASGDTTPADPVRADESGGLASGTVRSGTSPPSTTTAAPTSTTEAAATEPSTTIPPTSTTAPATTTTTFAARTAPNGTGSVPALSTSFRGWLAQLTSVPYDAGTDGLADEWERARAAVPGVVAARSDDWAAFRDGYWVLVDPGPFSSADDVRAFCTSVGAGDGECLPRELRG